jgi:hypothetical protein
MAATAQSSGVARTFAHRRAFRAPRGARAVPVRAESLQPKLYGINEKVRCLPACLPARRTAPRDQLASGVSMLSGNLRARRLNTPTPQSLWLLVAMQLRRGHRHGLRGPHARIARLYKAMLALYAT